MNLVNGTVLIVLRHVKLLKMSCSYIVNSNYLYTSNYASVNKYKKQHESH